MTHSDQVLTVAQMRAAEQALIDGGETVTSLMERAGKGVADWVWRIAHGRSVTVLCGSGNNGGDGYVIARELSSRGAAVVVVAPLEPATEAAKAARETYRGTIDLAGNGGVLVDCLFGSGLTRPLSPELAALLSREAVRHSALVAVDMPSGIDSDTGLPLNDGLPVNDVTVALGAWKFAHWLMPGMAAMGHRRLVSIGVEPVEGAATLLGRPHISVPAIDAHKYTRGLVLVVGGAMPGATQLASEGALRAGAGCIRLAAQGLHPSATPDLVLKRGPLVELLSDDRTSAVLAGPGLGLDETARVKLGEVLAADRPTVLDADALTLLRPRHCEGRSAALVLTPHEGEMTRLGEAFGIEAGSRTERALQLAEAAQAVVVAKGPDTLIAAPGGKLTIAPPATSWLSVAGSGDVLSGIAASRLATGADAFTAACEAVWLHGEAARLAGPAFTASGLARYVSEAYAAAL
ncbi:bifunctional ADP-dependent NAD(P)H-hydrate dehydratase/NAD(P)H-hydrate epimerase [Altererythrobacter sp. Root672]|uniref:bifunctional ADP-dependent NAD(P)H-hydrate dehydratase/NAD(P)H-hydrate epimerase n=1 Tax=Altererythrobacter sp. Root672 TaxID=1736584 RepID=UPI0006F305BD|nr:bifunctional ADP-dependent NAD(P)H-hydrate dehydratase/NAD(P)H-hydrate epimerase [Altererythrobacter sp. Root672]KRA83509.1 sugar kinase [Altererythrobacter sp. Root672]